MNDKSCNIHTARGPSTGDDLSNNKFIKEHYKTVKVCLDDDFSDKIPKVPTIDELKLLAEQEFINSYGKFPTCAVYAPGCFTLAGKSTNLAESKSLSMAIQLVTLVVGKRSRGSKRCRVKTLSDEIVGEKAFDFYLNTDNLDVSTEESSWIRYLKGTIQSFKARRAHVPGFKIVIASNVPVKRGLGSSSALVVAFYTFLEAITNTYTGNVIEKTLACHLAEKLAGCPYDDSRIADTLTSVIGREDTIFMFDARSLDIERCGWHAIDVEFVFIECGNVDVEEGNDHIGRYKEILTLMNTTSRWRTQRDATMMQLLYSRETINMSGDVVNEDERVSRMIDTVRAEQWEELGKLLRENYHSACKYLNSSSVDVERIAASLKTVDGVLGCGVIGRSYGASIITLVQRSKLKTFIAFLNRRKISKRYHIMKSCIGVSTLYTYERHFHSSDGVKHRPRLIRKYYLDDEDSLKTPYYSEFKGAKSLSLYIPRGPSVF